MRGVADIDITASADGDDFAVTLAASTTTNYTAGTYWWQAYVSKSGERYQVGSGTLEIKEDFSQVSGAYSKLSHARKVLAALEAMLERKATVDQQSYSIAGRSLSRMSPEELRSWRDDYRRQVRAEERAEKIARGEKINNTIRARFGGVS